MSGIGFLDAVARQAGAVEDRGRRPWPLPDGPWSQAWTRRDVLLAHWPVDPAALARAVPPGLTLDVLDGEAWFGLLASRVGDRRLRGLPPLPGVSSALEIELRTFVSEGTRPGLWLFSLELSRRLLVETAKRTHRLPAYHAEIELARDGEALVLHARRDGGVLELAARPQRGPSREPAHGLERFLYERYAIYTADGGRLYRAECHHSPWQLRPATVELGAASLLPLVPGGVDPCAAVAERQDVLLWRLEEL